jgi:hypothetical protein
VNDLGLCGECAAKLDQDLIRQRDWNYATSAYALDAAKREDLRKTVIDRYGANNRIDQFLRGRKESPKESRKKTKKGEALI